MRLPSSMAIGVLAFAAIFAIGTRMVGDRPARSAIDSECLELGTCDFDEGFDSDLMEGGSAFAPEAPSVGPEGCRNAGYLCFGLSERSDPRVMRWADGTREIRVRIDEPEFEDGTTSRELLRAANAGILTWQGTPFPIRIIRGGNEEVDFEVRWTQSLGGNQLGQTSTEWFRRGDESGMRVRVLTLVTRSPFNQRAILEGAQVRLTAAHEMGHALGLPHSDNPRDVMYPTNGASRISSADFETMNALYRLPNGALIDLEAAGFSR